MSLGFGFGSGAFRGGGGAAPAPSALVTVWSVQPYMLGSDMDDGVTMPDQVDDAASITPLLTANQTFSSLAEFDAAWTAHQYTAETTAVADPSLAIRMALNLDSPETAALNWGPQGNASAMLFGTSTPDVSMDAAIDTIGAAVGGRATALSYYDSYARSMAGIQGVTYSGSGTLICVPFQCLSNGMGSYHLGIRADTERVGVPCVYIIYQGS